MMLDKLDGNYIIVEDLILNLFKGLNSLNLVYSNFFDTESGLSFLDKFYNELFKSFLDICIDINSSNIQILCFSDNIKGVTYDKKFKDIELLKLIENESINKVTVISIDHKNSSIRRINVDFDIIREDYFESINKYKLSVKESLNDAIFSINEYFES